MRFEIERSGILMVVSAPSGGGKSAVLRELLKRDPEVGYSVSVTSRPLRANEQEGVDYHFVTREKFEEMVENGEFYEHAEVHGNLYGTCAKVVDQALADRHDIAMDIDVQGGVNIKKQQPHSVLIFLMPPSMTVLEQRLRSRASDSEDQIKLRLNNAAREIEQWRSYDYVVINENFDQTVNCVGQILSAERSKACRLEVLRAGKQQRSE